MTEEKTKELNTQTVSEKIVRRVCTECGISANVLTCLHKYGHPPEKLCSTVSTFHEGICDVCEQKKQVTEPRDFYHPNFELLKQYIGQFSIVMFKTVPTDGDTITIDKMRATFKPVV